MDKRWHELGDILVNYSTEVRPGERVMIAMKEVHTLPLVRAVYEAAVKAGAHVQVQFTSDFLAHSLMRYGSPDQVGWLPALEAYGMDWADVYIGLRGAHNLSELADVDAEVLARHSAAMGKISSLRWQKTRWCLVRVPDESLAQEAGTDVETLLDAFFAACLRDWAAEGRRWAAIARQLEGGDQVRITGKDTDLRFSVQGRRWLVANGKENMPDGEVWTAPINSTLDGCIYFEFPATLGGRVVEGMRLAWERGRLVSATATRNEDYLHGVLALDPGASLLGEFAFGLNYGLTRHCKDVLLDEKIGGTIHVALGRAYPESGGDNQSAIHWDIVKDTRQEGAVYLDGRLVFEKGQFVI